MQVCVFCVCVCVCVSVPPQPNLNRAKRMILTYCVISCNTAMLALTSPPHYWKRPPVIVSSTPVVVIGLMPDMLSLATSCPAPRPPLYCIFIPCTLATQQTDVDRYTLWFGSIWENIQHSDRKQYNVSDKWLFYSSPRVTIIGSEGREQQGCCLIHAEKTACIWVQWSNLHDELYLLVTHYEWMWW